MWKTEYRNRFTPSGRIGRKDYLKNSLFIFVCCAVFQLLAMATIQANVLISVISFVYGLILVYVNFCLMAKRMHDFGYRLWWLWIFIVAVQIIVGGIFGATTAMLVDYCALLFLFLKKGQPNSNKFGKALS